MDRKADFPKYSVHRWQLVNDETLRNKNNEYLIKEGAAVS